MNLGRSVKVEWLGTLDPYNAWQYVDLNSTRTAQKEQLQERSQKIRACILRGTFVFLMSNVWKSYQSDSLFMETRTYYWVCNRGSHVASGCHHIKQYTQFVNARNWNCAARFRINGDYRKNPVPCQSLISALNKYSNVRQAFSAKTIAKWHNTRYAALHGSGSNCSYSNPPTDRSAKFS